MIKGLLEVGLCGQEKKEGLVEQYIEEEKQE